MSVMYVLLIRLGRLELGMDTMVILLTTTKLVGWPGLA